MKWKSHAAITRAVCKELGVPEHYEEMIVDGAVEPDRNPVLVGRSTTKRLRVAHHGRSDRATTVLLWKARAAYLDGDDEHACRHLGRALHYIQDRCVSRCLSWHRHCLLEERIMELAVPHGQVINGIRHSKSSPDFIRSCVKAIRPSSEPFSALAQATFYSAAIISSVLDGPDPPPSIEEMLRRSSIIRTITLVTSAVSATILIFLALGSAGPLLLVLLIIPAVSMAISERRYRSLIELAEWHGCL
ncbi:MAG: hypothetical protein HPY73_04460 [Methanomassiliicoccales archaeon]|nr:MAG: hypothetical protein HPY73_04460 [Methanomassiliicoccales archaeon]